VLVAHRDTHFAFLERIEVGDLVQVETAPGRRARYRVSEVTIMDKDEARVMDEPGLPQLTLITCYPFDAVRPGTKLRYVVIAARIDDSQDSMKAS
jgi:sortase A